MRGSHDASALRRSVFCSLLRWTATEPSVLKLPRFRHNLAMQLCCAAVCHPAGLSPSSTEGGMKTGLRSRQQGTSAAGMMAKTYLASSWRCRAERSAVWHCAAETRSAEGARSYAAPCLVALRPIARFHVATRSRQVCTEARMQKAELHPAVRRACSLPIRYV